jgi:hypothetical protein
MEAIIDKNKSVLACVLGVGGDEIINGFTNVRKKSLIPF